MCVYNNCSCSSPLFLPLSFLYLPPFYPTHLFLPSVLPFSSLPPLSSLSPLQLQACRENHVEVVKLLLDYGCNPSTPFPNSRQVSFIITLGLLATEHGCTSVLLSCVHMCISIHHTTTKVRYCTCSMTKLTMERNVNSGE